MTVGELKRKLENLDDDLPVRMAFPSGDYWRTVIAGTIDAVEICQVEWSKYHNNFTLPKEGKEPEEGGEESVVLI